MKKSLLIILSAIFSVSFLNAQSPVYDALFLKNILDITGKYPLESRDTVYSILSKYLKEDDIEFGGFNSSNPFMKKYFPSGGVFVSPNIIEGVSKSLLSSVGNLDVTNIADGLTKFLIERAKEELSVAFFAQFKKDLADEKYEDLRLLFPQTYRTLQLIDQKIYQYSAYLNSLREVFILDLNSLPNTLPIVISKPLYAEYFKKNPVLKLGIQFGVISSNFLINKKNIKHVGIVIDSLLKPDLIFPIKQPNDTANWLDANINGSIKTFQLVSFSLRSTDISGIDDSTQKYWVGLDSLLMLVSDVNAFNIYLGLIYQQAANQEIKFAKGKKLTEILDTIAINVERINNISRNIYGLYSSFNRYENYRSSYKNIQHGIELDSLSFNSIGMVTASIDIFESGTSLLKEWVPGLDSIIEKFTSVVRDLNEIYLFSRQKKYGLAVLSVGNLYQNLFEEGSDPKLPGRKLVARFVKYGTFMAEISSAENSDQVKEIIQHTALPTGSSFIKKQSRFNIALNAYIGGFWGNEYLAEKEQQNWASTAGVYAPVGINFSKGILNKNGKSFGSASILLNLIDLGTFASFRLQDELTEKLPEVKLENIFAPGLGLVYGFPKVPISLGYTYQLGPTLREISPDAIQTSEKLNRRWQFFLGVDIPLLNFYNKPK